MLAHAHLQSENIKFFKVYRWDPDVPNQKPYLATYPVDMDECVIAACNADEFTTDAFFTQMWPNAFGRTD